MRTARVNREWQIQEALADWRESRDQWNLWDSIEALHFALAAITDRAAFRFREQSWDFLIPDYDGCIRLVCAVTDTGLDVEKAPERVPQEGLDFRYHTDHWTRTLGWSLDAARGLSDEVPGARVVASTLASRVRSCAPLRALCGRLLPRVVGAYQQVYGRRPDWLPPVTLGLATFRLAPGKVASHHAATRETPYAILTIHPKVTRDPVYLEQVVMHELMHYVRRASADPDDEHDEQFREMGRLLGVPRKFLD